MRLSLLLVLVCSAAAAAPAAVPEDLQQKLTSLEDEVARLRVQLPAAADALHTVENRLEVMARELERLAATREAEPAVRNAVDELRVEVDAIERRLASAQARLSEVVANGEPTVRIGYADGAYLKAGPVTLTTNLAMMPRYQGILREGRSNDSGFDLHHGQVALRGTIYEFVDVQLMLDFGGVFWDTNGHIGILRDAFLDVRPLPWLTLRAGQFQVPFSRQRLTSDFHLTFAERTVATRAFSFDRDLGGEIEFALVHEKLLLQVAVTDGVMAGPAVHNDNIDFAYTVRIVGQPLGALPRGEGDVQRTRKPRFSVGGAFQFNLVPNDQGVDLNRDGVVDNVEVLSANGELAFKWRGLAVEGEYFFRYEKPGAGLRHHVYQGAYGQASMMLWRGLQVGGRFSWSQPHALGGQKLGLFGDQPRWDVETGGVINYYVWREMVRAQVSYDYRREETALPPRKIEWGQVVQVQVQAGF